MAQLCAAARAVVGAMGERAQPSGRLQRQRLAQRMAPFFTPRYYYMFDYFNYSTNGAAKGVQASERADVAWP